MSSEYYLGLLQDGHFYEMGTGGRKKNNYTAYQIYQKIPFHVERGEARYRMGKLCMANDDSFGRNYQAAKKHFEDAALMGHGGARYSLGQMYEQGQGVKKDYAIAKRYYHQALDVGYERAAKDIGMMFLISPPGVFQDSRRAKMYLERYEEHCKKDAHLQIALGDYYRLKKSDDYFSKAAGHYRKAIALKNGLGCYWIGQMYEQYSLRNLNEAVKWYQQGKTLKDAKCIWRLAQLHVSGEVLEKDIGIARALFTDAAKKGCEEAKKELNELNAQIAKRKPNSAGTVNATNTVKKGGPGTETTLSDRTTESKEKPNEKEGRADAQSDDVESTDNFQPLSWDRMRKCFEANGMVSYEAPAQTSTTTSKSDEPLFKIIEIPPKHNANITNQQVRLKINEQFSRKPSKLVLKDYDNKARGYKFKTKADLKKQFKKARVSSPFSPIQMLELSTIELQSKQAQITHALDTTNNFLFKNIMSLSLKLNRMSTEIEQAATTINSNNEDIVRKFEQVENSVDNKYKNVCQRLDLLERESAEKDKAIELLLAKLNTQSQQLETLMRLAERQ
ncbi:hypothetical protein PS6_010462 [Mucor atramentarius]